MRITGLHGSPAAAFRPRALLVLLTALLLPALWAQGAAAQSGERVFTVRGIDVDVTADSPSAARERALAQGQARAMRALLERLVVQEDQAAIPALSAAEVEDYVQDFSVSDERTSDVRYIASLTVRFRPGAVRRLLRANGVRFAEVQSKPVLVLPVWGQGAETRLWDGANPWLSAWVEVSDVHELVPVITPLGDLEDLRDIDAAQAMSGDSVRLRTIEERYGAGSVLVSHLVPQGDADVGLGAVKVDSKRYREGELDGTFVDSFSQQSGEDQVALLERAAQTISNGLQQEWKRANVISFDELQRLTVAVPLSGLQEWLTVRRRLEGLASVAAADLQRLTRARAVIDLAFYGSLDQLLGQLEQRDLVLTRTSGGSFGSLGGTGRGGTGTGAAGTGGNTVIVSGRNAGSTLSGMQTGAAMLGEEPEPQWELTTRESAAAGAASGMGQGDGIQGDGMQSGVMREPAGVQPLPQAGTQPGGQPGTEGGQSGTTLIQ
jgi:hypothetical protein